MTSIYDNELDENPAEDAKREVIQKYLADKRKKNEESLLEGYDRASSEEGIESAKDRQGNLNMAAGIGEIAGALLGGAPAKRAYVQHWNDTSAPKYADPGKGVDFGAAANKLRSIGASQVEDEKLKRKKAVEDYLMRDKLGQQEKERARVDTKELEMNDPNSAVSQRARALSQKLNPGAKVDGLSANQLADTLGYDKEIFRIEESAAQRREARIAADKQNQLARDLRQQDKEEDRKYKSDEKKRETLVEIEDRRTNIKQNLGILSKMIEEDGTFELFGSHNQDFDRLVETIATDMAKLADPSSVARPSEVESVKKNLIRSGLSNRNSTAQDIITNFANEVDARADSAYKIRGIELNKNQPNTKPAWAK